MNNKTFIKLINHNKLEPVPDILNISALHPNYQLCDDDDE